MGVGQLSESDAVDALRLPFYSSSHPTGSHGWRNQFDLGNPDLCVFLLKSVKNVIAQRDRAQSGPDILVKEAGETIWIEAVTPTPGEPPRPDRADGEVYPVPDDSLLLRFLQAMNDKRNRLQPYVDDSLIAPDDLRIIAINAGDQKGFGGSIRLHAVGQSRGAKQLLR